MINANKEVLNSFFSSSLQYVVPFFQRSYVWDEENWEILWDHVERTALAISNGNIEKEHFIGTLITKQRQAQAVGENKLDVVDGQQRLTTFALLFKAIADSVSEGSEFLNLAENTNALLVFKDSKGVQHNRIEHSKNDKPYFDAVLNGADLAAFPNQSHRILLCYGYFKRKLKDFSDEQLDGLKSIILNNVPLISMLLSANDDEQEIFDTINSLGVRLTTGELLKNFIFSDIDIRAYYESLWEPVFESDEDQIEFWNKKKTSGRFTRTNVEVLLYCYLIIQTKKPVELDRLFKEYKIWLTGKSLEERIEILKDIKRNAELYFAFPDSTALNQIAFSNHEARFFHVIENFEITTVYPLILFLYGMTTDRDELGKMLRIIESYIARRQVCKLTTKNYNNVFIKIIKDFEEIGEVSAEALEAILDEYTDDGNRKPGDAEFARSFSETPISNKNANEVLFCIALYQVDDVMADMHKLSSKSYTVEHMMPQKWEENWFVEGMDENAKHERNQKIKTLGNLTLVTQPLNSSMKNGPWIQKREALIDHSHLKITTGYTDRADWNESEIAARANDLASVAVKIWR
ncbi:MAG: DUF262 domain-containing HNH endonuclease family protein [Pyrinomonadaceae bacterium]